MKKTTSLWMLALLVALAGAGVAAAAEIPLTAVLYPEKKTIEVPFTVSSIGPSGAEVYAKVEYKDNQSRIEIRYKKMQPAILFAGNITTYTVWAVTKDGVSENLGPLNAFEAKGDQDYTTGQREFALIVTAEPVSGTVQPSTLVVLTSGTAKSVEAKSTPFTFSRFANPWAQALVKPGNPSIAGLNFTPGGEPVELTRARRVVEMAEGMQLGPDAQKNLDQAKIQLAQATNATKGGSTRTVVDYSSRSAALASEAVRLTIRQQYEKMQAEEAARKAAEKAALEKGLATTKSEKEQVEAMLAQVQKEKAEVEADRAKVKAERDALAARLNGALEKIMAVRQSARGIVMDLGDVLFDVNKATLKPGARESLAKLSGVLLMLPEVNVRIEGFTDSTGTAERNKVLSADRARSVYDYLKSEGIDAARLSDAGYGPANPVADNATAAGRAKNRRVELTFAQGPIEPTPGGYTAPEKPAAAKAPAKKAPAKPAAKPAEGAKKG
ncbi:MAG: OmpA family protein [Acidithiobacillales bacterium]